MIGRLYCFFDPILQQKLCIEIFAWWGKILTIINHFSFNTVSNKLLTADYAVDQCQNQRQEINKQ